MFYQLLLVALVFLMAISTLNNVSDAEGETARTVRRALSIIAVAVLVAFLVFHRLALREGMIGTMAVGFVALAAIGVYHLRAQGRRTAQTVGVYLGSNAVEGRSAKDSTGRELPLYEPVFEYEYRGEMYCTPARDLYFLPHAVPPVPSRAPVPPVARCVESLGLPVRAALALRVGVLRTRGRLPRHRRDDVRHGPDAAGHGPRQSADRVGGGRASGLTTPGIASSRGGAPSA